MSVQWKQEIKIPDETRSLIRNCQDKQGLVSAIAKAMDYQNEKTATIIRRKLAGSLLRRVTGHLANSIGQTDALVILDSSGGQVRSSVGSGVSTGAESVSYAAPLEFGSRPHVIEAKNKKALRFAVNGQILLRTKVNHPGNRAYSYVRGTVEERLTEYQKGLGGAAFNFLTGKKD